MIKAGAPGTARVKQKEKSEAVGTQAKGAGRKETEKQAGNRVAMETHRCRRMLPRASGVIVLRAERVSTFQTMHHSSFVGNEISFVF